jgi:hypothetical protein
MGALPRLPSGTLRQAIDPSAQQWEEGFMKRALLTLTVLVSGGAGRLVGDEAVTLESVPPVVVQTVPAAGSENVDPKLAEIKVTFSKDMKDGNWSWATLSENSFPKVDGKPKYLADKRTCVLPVKLEAGKTYAIWVNGEKFLNFKDTRGTSAVPYLLVFNTKK